MKQHEIAQFCLITLITCDNMQTSLCDTNNFEENVLEKNNDMFVLTKICQTLSCKIKIKILKIGGKFVNTLAYYAKRKILLNNQLLKHAVRNVVKNNM